MSPSWLRPFPASTFPDIPWEGGPDWAFSHPEDDEGHHAGTWTYKKRVLPATPSRAPSVVAVLRISGDFRTRRPVSYGLSIALNHVAVPVCRARCTSVRQAKEHAGLIDLYEPIHTLLRRLYNKNRARCVFMADGTPLMSVFDDFWGWRDGLPSTHYYDIDPIDDFRGRHIHHTEIWGSGYCAGSIPAERAEFAKTLQPWT